MSALLLAACLVTQATSLPAAADVAPGAKPYLIPGPGWSGATAPTRYAGDREDAVSIAHWTRIPDQVLWREGPDDFRLGVLAYHRSQIDVVRFAVDDGPWLDVDTMSLSSQTDHYEYGVCLRRRDFVRGWHEVRALAVPRQGVRLGGTERVLTWRFYSGDGEVAGIDFGERWVDSVNGSDTNAGTAGAPFATVRRAVDSLGQSPTGADGGAIYLLGGPTDRVVFGGTTSTIRNDVPLEITSAPGHAPIFAPNSSTTVDELAVAKVRIDGLTIDLSWDDMFRTGVDAFDAQLYVTGCVFRGITRPRNLNTSAYGVVSGIFDLDDYGLYDGVHVASSEFRNIDGIPVLGVYWMRDTLVQNVRHLGLPAVRCAIDCTVRDVRRGMSTGGATGWLPLEPPGDTSPIENILVDGCRLFEIYQNAGFLGHADTEGIALVNSIFTGGYGGGSPDYFFIGYLKVSQFHGHTLLLGCTLPRSGFYFDYPYIFGTVDIYPDSLMRGVAARVFFDENLSTQPNPNNLTGPEVSGMRFDPDYTHTYAGAPPAWSTWTQGSAASTYVNAAQDDYRIRPTSGAWGRIPLSESWHRYDIDGRLRGARTGMTAIGAVRGVGE